MLNDPVTPKTYRWLIPAFAFPVALFAFLVFLPSLNNAFVNWDDWLYMEDPNLSPIDARFFKWVFTSEVAGNWHPLTVITYALDFRIWGLNPRGYHLENIALHAVNTALVYALGARLAGIKGQRTAFTLIAAASAAVLFGIHPLHVESVTWIAERKDVLSAFFFVLSILAYAGYAGGPAGRPGHYAASLILFILALLSKPMAITLPAVLLIMDLYPLERLKRARDVGALFIEKAPFFLLSGTSAYLTIWAQGHGGAIMPIERYPFIFRAALAVRSIAFYLYKAFLPVDLAPFYPMPGRGAFFNEWLAVSLILLIVITALCLLYSRRRRIFLAAWLYCLVTLSPVIGIIQVGSQAAADRYMYIPSIAPFLLAGAGLASLIKALDGKKALQASALAAAVAVAAALSFLTIRQEAVWKDSVTLWSHEIRLYPAFALPYNFRGHAYFEINRYEEALSDYGAAIRLQPGFPDYYINRGVVYKDMRNYSAALEDFMKAIELKPDMGIAYHNLGAVYSDIGEAELASAARRMAAELGYR